MWPVLLLLFLNYASPQPVTDDGLSRQTRELIECCPCPTSRVSNMAAGSEVGRASSVDDCPCRARSSDSEGAPSIFFPSRVRPDGPFMRPSKSKDDQKNLLEPEVGLATSMLQTLREATEEEYQDALARDAARTAAGLDAAPEESARNVVIIVNPNEDDDLLVPEASRTHESRCIHPLSTPLGSLRTASKPMKKLPDFLRMPRLRGTGLTHRNLLDMDSNVGASNVQEKVVNPNEVFKSFPRIPFFRQSIPFKSIGSFRTDEKSLDEDLQSKSPLFGHRLSIPNLKLPNHFLKSPSLNNDLNPASTNVQEVTENREGQSGILRLAKRPIPLRNLLKLKDVELVPKKTNPLPKLKLGSPLRTLPAIYKKEAEDDCVTNNVEDNTAKSPDLINSNSNHNVNKAVEEIKNKQNIILDDASQQMNLGDDISAENTKSQFVEDMKDPISSASDLIHSTLDNTEENIETNYQEKSSEDDDDCGLSATNSVSAKDLSIDQESREISDIEQELATNDVQNNNNNIVTEEETAVESDGSILDEQNSDNGTVEDSENDSSNLNPVTIEQSDNLDVNKNMFEDGKTAEEISDSDDIPKQTDSVTKNTKLPILPLSETLSTIRENVKKTLEKLKIKPNNKIIENIPDKISEVPSANHDLNEKSNDESEDFKEPKSTEEKDNNITFNDIQKISDDLLHSSSNKNENKLDCGNNMSNDETTSNNSDEVKEDQNIEEEKIEARKETEADSTDEKSAEDLKEKACPITTENKESNMKTSEPEKESNEMAAEASEPVINTVPELLDPLGLLGNKLSLPLMPDLPVLPTLPANPLNLQLKPLNEVSNLNPLPALPSDPLNLQLNPLDGVLNLKPLPTLDDLKDHLENIFDTDDRGAGSDEIECDEDDEGMTPAASNTDFQRNVPSLKPLQDFNVDIFNLKPMKNSQDASNGLPRLNLNSYRARLPAPSNLDLKPIRLESSVRNKDGILGASLNFNNKKNTLRKSASNNLNVLRNPLPSIEDLKDSLRLNHANILSNPVKQPDLSFLKDAQPTSISELTESIRRNAEKTRKGIEKKMKNSLQAKKINEPLAKPQELFEDVEDKLKAIHYDLNDRITSLHENLFDNTKLKPLPSLKSNSGGLRTNVKGRPLKPKPMRLQSAASSTSFQNIDPREEMSNERKSFANYFSNNGLKIPNRAQRLNSDASALTPVEVKMPKHSPFVKSASGLHNEPNFRRFGDDSSRDLDDRNIPAINRKTNLNGIRRPVFRKPGSLRESKVTITFGSTTAAPIVKQIMTTTTSPLKAKRPDIKLSMKPNNFMVRKNNFVPRTTNVDENESPSEIRKSKNPLPFPKNLHILREPNFSQLERVNQEAPSSKFANTRLHGVDTLKHGFNNKLEHTRPKNNEEIGNEQSELWPKDFNTENKFLTNVRDGFIERRNNLIKHKADDAKTVPLKSYFKTDNVRNPSNTDMARAASNNDLILVEEPLKENVSYKCRMVCTKE